MNEVTSTPQGIKKLEAYELAPYLSPFTAKMKSVGYTTLTINLYSAAVRHFGAWLNVNGISPCDITPTTVERFSTHTCTCSGFQRNTCLSRKYIQRVTRFVDYLREINVIDDDSQCHTEPLPAWDQDGFASWLICDRGLASITVANYVRTLTRILPALGFDTQHYTARKIRNVVCDYAERHGPGNAKQVTTALRSYLKYLVSKDLCLYSLVGAVPSVAHWRLSALPRYISVEEVQRVVQSCDTERPVGIRDHAILLLLARLGLRASDIVKLLVSDIDWTKSTLLVRGKSRHVSRLPLPQDVGDAILHYLVSGRVRNTTCEQLFLCTTAPYRPLSTPSIVSGIVQAAIVRSGIDKPPSSGAHLLRHSAATGWLREGIDLDTISTILRHGNADMTMHYAKVNVNALSELIVAWPGSAS